MNLRSILQRAFGRPGFSDRSVSGVRFAPSASRIVAVKSSAALRGLWDYRCLRPVAVSDPELFDRIARAYGRLPFNVERRLFGEAPTVSDKFLKGLIFNLRSVGDTFRLGLLERTLSGGGLRWADGYQNLVVNEGLNHLLDVVLSGGTQDTSWFVGLLDSDAAPGASWTATEIAGDDFVAYDEATLPAFTDGGVSGQSLSNTASPAAFTISTNGSVIGGAYLIGTNAKATPAGTLYAAGTFTGGDKSADDNDTLEVTATFSAADDGV